MGFSRAILLSILLVSTICSLSEGYNFVVGGKNGWSLTPSESYSQWSGRLRFQVNDTLAFKYAKESDSVLVVSKDDYEKCATANPILKMDGGDSVFKFDRSGPFYFITGNKTNCDQGQKLIVVVLAIRNKSPPSPAVPSPSPATLPPAQSPGSLTPVPSPAQSPGSLTPVPSPVGQAPVPSPVGQAPVPSPESQAPGPSPSSEGPAVSPAPESSGPVVSPPAGAPGAPGAGSPSGAPGAGSPLSPGNTPSGGSSPPSASESFAPSVSPATVVSVVLSVTVAGFIRGVY